MKEKINATLRYTDRLILFLFMIMNIAIIIEGLSKDNIKTLGDPYVLFTLLAFERAPLISRICILIIMIILFSMVIEIVHKKRANNENGSKLQ